MVRTSFFLFGIVLSIGSAVAQRPQPIGNFVRAQGISLDPQGNIYVADAGAHAVQKFDPSGKSLAGIGGFGWGQLEFDQPYDVCATHGLDVFVADNGNHRIQRYNRKLEYIATLYTRETDDESRRFGYPSGVTVNRFGDLFVSDRENHRVIRVSGFGRAIRPIGGIDAGKGRLIDPLQVEVGPDDMIYVLERNRIVQFDNFGNYIATIGGDTLHSATGISADGYSLFVADGRSVLEFASSGRLSRVIPCDRTDSDLSGQPCVDVAAEASRLFVLHPTHFVVVER